MAALRTKFEGVLRPLYNHIIASRTPPPRPDANTLVVECKYTGKTNTSVILANEEETLTAIKAAYQAKEAMKNLKSYERKDILLNIARGIEKRQEELTGAICWEVGKPVRDAQVEVARAIDTFTIAAEEAVRRVGEFSPLDISARNAPYSMISQQFPIGVISMISPFNFPVNLVAHKVAPAIAAGCPFVLKPSERTPLGAFLIGEIIQEAGGLPDGAFSVLLPENTHIASHLVTSELVSCFSFTGSPQVGWYLKNLAGRKRVLLELGGNAAVVVDEHADVKVAAERILFGAFYSAGQSCISVQRIYVHQSRYAELRALLQEGAANLSRQRGDPFDPATFLGPMIAQTEVQRIQKALSHAIQTEGVSVLSGGNQSGRFFDCTVVEGATDDSSLNRKEAFAPICTLQAYDDFKEVLDRVNDSEFGLQAGVFTNDINRAFYAFNKLDVGGVVINDIPSVRVDSQPYGGIKASGIGREGLRDCIQEFSEKKVLILKNLGKL